MTKAVIYIWVTRGMSEQTLYFHREHFDPLVEGALMTLDQTGHWEQTDPIWSQSEKARLVDVSELPAGTRCQVCREIIIEQQNAGTPPIDM